MTSSGVAQTEAQFQQAVTDLATTCGWLVYHTHDSRHSAAGFPDLVLVRGHKLLFCELKSERGRVSDAQHRWLTGLAATGAETHVWRPADWDEIVGELTAVQAVRATIESRQDGT